MLHADAPPGTLTRWTARRCEYEREYAHSLDDAEEV